MRPLTTIACKSGRLAEALALVVAVCAYSSCTDRPSHASHDEGGHGEATPTPATQGEGQATSPTPSETTPDPEAAEGAPDWVERIDDPQTWQRMSAASSEHAIARTEVVKLLLDHETDRLYYCQSSRWPIHYDFALRFIQTESRVLGDRRAFNTRQYLRADRQMQMASIVHYRDADLWTLELGPADNLDGPGVLALFERVRDSTYFGASLRYRPRSPRHQARVRDVAGAVRVIETNALWHGVSYQPITLGAAVGRLRFVEGPVDPATVLPDQILVLDHVPTDIPLSAGIITAQLQAPLAHVAVLSQSRGTPNMALRGVMGGALRALDDQLVRLEVRGDDFEVVPSSEAAMRESLAANRPAPVAAPVLDPTREALADTCALRLRDAVWAGAKAAQLGEVCSAGVPTSAGFVIPVHHYLAHLSRHGIDASASAIREASGSATDGRARGRALEALRTRITNAPVDPDLVADVRHHLGDASGRRWIFRSSTNAEDLPGFSGAGLYESAVTDAAPDDAGIARAIARVWASTWSRRAFDERAYYGVDHDVVGMAILVQAFLEDVAAMGVAITENPFSTTRSGILVNLAPTSGSVTAATGEELPEQILLYRSSLPEVISRSTRNGGQPILATASMRPLRNLLDRVHSHMRERWTAPSDAVDIELALLRDGSAVILQARPYHMRR